VGSINENVGASLDEKIHIKNSKTTINHRMKKHVLFLLLVHILSLADSIVQTELWIFS